jgi:hypothetical protein
MTEATELIGVQTTSDGTHLKLRIRNEVGQIITLTLPASWLNTMLNALPPSSRIDAVHTLDSWSMARVGDGPDLVLTLRTPEGQAVSFAVKPWHVEGMATIATYGASGRTSNITIH